jgi:CHAT domain-containing protein/tetratricopeptide (TPR) repeat protein
MALALVLLAGVFGGAGSAAAQYADDVDALNRRVLELYGAGKYAEAVPLARRYADAMKARRGSDHPDYATALNNLSQLLVETNQLAEAEPPMRRALAIDEKSFGPEHPNVARDLGNLALLLKDTNRLAEAEPLMRRALAIDEKTRGAQHPKVAIRLSTLAGLLEATNRLSEAEPLYRRALAIDEKSFGPEHPNVATRLNNLGALLRAKERLAEAEALYRRALAIRERELGPEHPAVATTVNNLAGLLLAANRPAEAEPLYRRALAIDERSFGPEHPNVARDLNNLAQVLQDTGRIAEAEPLMRRVIAVYEKSLGPEHPNVSIGLGNLAELLRSTNRLSQAEPLYRRALAIDEKSLGPDHPSVAVGLRGLARLQEETGRPAQAEPLYRRALAIDEKSFGPRHPKVAISLNNLAALRAALGDWTEAARLHRRAVPILTDPRGPAEGAFAKVGLTRNTWALRAAARAVYRAEGGSPAARAEGFELAQWALHSSAADALAQMSVRFAKGTGPLAALVRERQNLVAQRQGEDKRLLAAVGKADTRASDAIRTAVAELDAKLDAIDRRLAAQFPDYASLASPRPLALPAAQALLRKDEALIVLLDVPRIGTPAEETLAWAVTKNEARWASIPLGPDGLSERVAKLRCGLDREGQWTWVGQSRRWGAKGERCRTLAPGGLADGEPLPFDLGTAHELYAQLLAPFADLTRDKHLIIVPSGPLTSLPFHVLVTAARNEAGTAGLPPAWLALELPITVLPSVASLQALRKLPPSQANDPYIAFGNPLLDGVAGEGARAKLARAKQSCPQEVESPRRRVAATGRGTPDLGDIFRSGVNLGLLRAQSPLPETADELCAVAKSLGALGREADTVWLGARATEANLKALSRAGALARYRVLHFATHGVLAGESETILKAKAEPALLLSPPKDGATPAAMDEDDGLLTASEVAQLELDADWVVLSACNTAAGGKGDAEALSGLARAFFYAKARALLVSHWYVNSEAAVKLTTGAFDALRVDLRISRAEALRRSMARLIKAGRPDEAHPEYWAPFVLVGEHVR